MTRARRGVAPSSCAEQDLDGLRLALEAVVARCDVEERLRNDPVGIVRRFGSPAEQEIVGLLAASLAFGNVKALRASVERVLERLGSDLLEVIEDAGLARSRLRGTGHRMVRDVDIARLLVGARAMQVRHGSLGARFAELVPKQGVLRDALIPWVAELRATSGLRPAGARRGPAHILPDPSGTSACKRLLLYLRWMIRRNDGVDLGVWDQLSPSILLVPVDTHVHRLALNLGWTARATASWQAAEEITGVLRTIDPHDPVRFDFALCHLGMLQGCASRRDATLCVGCGVRPVCRHWR